MITFLLLLDSEVEVKIHTHIHRHIHTEIGIGWPIYTCMHIYIHAQTYAHTHHKKAYINSRAFLSFAIFKQSTKQYRTIKSNNHIEIG